MLIDLDDWEKLPTQREVYDNDWTKIIVQSAGLGSGKTHNLCRKLIKLSALNQGYPGAILCPTYKDFRRDVKPEMFTILEDHMGLIQGKHFWFHGSSSEFSFIWNKKPLYVLSGEKPIAGPNLAYCGINEFSLIQYERIKEMLRRVRLKEAPYKQRILVGTPEDVHGWLEDFVEMQESNLEIDPNGFAIYYADTRENTFVDDEYRAHLESMLDDQALKVFASGQIVRLSGDYYYYAFERQKNIARVEYDKTQMIHCGLDFNVGKMACHFGHTIGKGADKEYHVFDELLLKGDSDTNKMCVAIKNRYPIDKILVTCDASGRARKTAGRSDVDILKAHGFEVRFKAANPKHRDRQLLINGLLSKSKVLIHPRCKGLIKDLEKVQQNKHDYSKVKDKDDNLTHFSDGLDYVLDFEYNLAVKRSRTIQL